MAKQQPAESRALAGVEGSALFGLAAQRARDNDVALHTNQVGSLRHRVGGRVGAAQSVSSACARDRGPRRGAPPVALLAIDLQSHRPVRRRPKAGLNPCHTGPHSLTPFSLPLPCPLPATDDVQLREFDGQQARGGLLLRWDSEQVSCSLSCRLPCSAAMPCHQLLPRMGCTCASTAWPGRWLAPWLGWDGAPLC